MLNLSGSVFIKEAVFITELLKAARKLLYLTDQEIIQGCIKGDSACQKQLFERYAGKMYTVCLRYARHRMEAEDIMQDGFVKVFNHIAKLENHNSLETWIRRIMINTAIKNYSKSSFQKEKIGLDDYYERSENPTVLSDLSEQELMGEIGKLPDGYRVVFNMYAIEGYSHKEISDKLGIGESTSRSQLVKARRMLQENISKLFNLMV